MHKTHCPGSKSRGCCLGSVRIVGLLAWVPSKLWVASPRASLPLPPPAFVVTPGFDLGLWNFFVVFLFGFFDLLFVYFWFVVRDLVFLICSSWFSGLKSLYGTQVFKTRVPIIEIKSLKLDLLHQNRVHWAQDVSFLNSLETVLTNEIVWNLLLFSNFSCSG